MPRPVELFPGQVIALLPAVPRGAIADPLIRRELGRLFPRTLDRNLPAPRRPTRPRTYSLMLHSLDDDGELTIGSIEIPVHVMAFDLSTPTEAAVFRVSAVAGRALRISGVAEGET